jgi:hypothetical protein
MAAELVCPALRATLRMASLIVVIPKERTRSRSGVALNLLEGFAPPVLRCRSVSS